MKNTLLKSSPLLLGLALPMLESGCCIGLSNPDAPVRMPKQIEVNGTVLEDIRSSLNDSALFQAQVACQTAAAPLVMEDLSRTPLHCELNTTTLEGGTVDFQWEVRGKDANAYLLSYRKDDERLDLHFPKVNDPVGGLQAEQPPSVPYELAQDSRWSLLERQAAFFYPELPYEDQGLAGVAYSFGSRVRMSTPIRTREDKAARAFYEQHRDELLTSADRYLGQTLKECQQDPKRVDEDDLGIGCVHYFREKTRVFPGMEKVSGYLDPSSEEYSKLHSLGVTIPFNGTPCSVDFSLREGQKGSSTRLEISCQGRTAYERMTTEHQEGGGMDTGGNNDTFPSSSKTDMEFPGGSTAERALFDKYSPEL